MVGRRRPGVIARLALDRVDRLPGREEGIHWLRWPPRSWRTRTSAFVAGDFGAPLLLSRASGHAGRPAWAWSRNCFATTQQSCGSSEARRSVVSSCSTVAAGERATAALGRFRERMPSCVSCSAAVQQARPSCLQVIDADARSKRSARVAGARAFAQTRACGHGRPDDRFCVLGARRLAIGLPRSQQSRRARRTSALPG